MKKLVEKIKNLSEKRQIEYLHAELAKQAGLVDYIAMMADVEIPVEEDTINVG